MRRALIVVGSLITTMAIVGGIRATTLEHGSDIGTYATSAMLAGIVTYIVWREES